MKSIEQVREEYKQCPKGHEKKYLIFVNESVHCEKCNDDYDLGMKKFK